MKETLKTWLFLLVLSLIVSAGLTGISVGLKDRIEQNLKMQKIHSLLDVLDVQGRDHKTDAERLMLFEKKVATDPQQPGVYYYREEGKVEAIAFEMSGKGLWDQIKGLMSVEKDGQTIRGIRFYEQAETPGLGGEIGTRSFENNFVGKKIYHGEAALELVMPGIKSTLSDTQVHGITGATLTCDSVNIILRQSILTFRKAQEDSKP